MATRNELTWCFCAAAHVTGTDRGLIAKNAQVTPSRVSTCTAGQGAGWLGGFPVAHAFSVGSPEVQV